MSLSFFWLAVGAGFLAIITPCVLPLIPITAAYFSDRGKSRADAIRSGFIFALGIIFTFSVIGLGVSATVGASGLTRFASDAAVNIVLALVFAFFGSALFRSTSLSLPSGLLNGFYRFASRYDSRSVVGPLLLGALFALTSFSCTTPFVGSLLVLAARGQWTTPILGMLVFATVFALPFFVLAVLPGFTQQLPKSGPWLEKTKRIVGLLELCAAIKFASNADMVLGWGIFTREIVLTFWLIFGILALLVVVFTPAMRRKEAMLRQVVVALIAGPCSFLVAQKLGALNLGEVEAFLPSRAAAAPSASPAAISTTGVDAGWIMNDYSGALAKARTSGKPVFIDFTGYTCTNCRWMEANIFAKPEVKKALDGFVLARLYTDGEGEMYEKQQAFQEEKFSTVALPLYAIVDANGKTVATLAGLTRSPEEFLAFLARKSD
jgi:thiol:disulfide interchange protein DsbD